MAGWGAAALAVLGFAGSISPLADLASHFRVLYALAMIPAIMTYLPRLRRLWWRPAILTVVLVLDIATIAFLYVPPGHPAAIAIETTIRLLQFNTWLENQEVQPVLSLIEAEKPDVAALQETTDGLRAAIASSLQDRYQILSAGPDLLLIRRDTPSIQMREGLTHVLPEDVAIEARLVIAGREVNVLSLHAMAASRPRAGENSR